jgi:hypothetical protein
MREEPSMKTAMVKVHGLARGVGRGLTETLGESKQSPSSPPTRAIRLRPWAWLDASDGRHTWDIQWDRFGPAATVSTSP